MPRPDSDLPETTGAVVADRPTGDLKATARQTTDRLVGQVREQVATLKDQAGGRLRTYAEERKGKASNLLDDISAVIEDAARSIEQRLGEEYGDYAHRAAEAVSKFSGKVREKSVDEIVADGREIVRKSPAVAIAAAAVVGFALVRLLRNADGTAGNATDGDGD
jgi:ElaB/YqjD/DUF883 family membrane-anchored ribosome-binding protein